MRVRIASERDGGGVRNGFRIKHAISAAYTTQARVDFCTFLLVPLIIDHKQPVVVSHLGDHFFHTVGNKERSCSAAGGAPQRRTSANAEKWLKDWLMEASEPELHSSTAGVVRLNLYRVHFEEMWVRS